MIPIQLCQVHKRRNVLNHVTSEDKPIDAQKLNAACALEDYAAAKQSLYGLQHRELTHLNPSVARSLAEGLEWPRSSSAASEDAKTSRC